MNKGVALAIFSAFVFSVMNALIKAASLTIPSAEIVFFPQCYWQRISAWFDVAGQGDFLEHRCTTVGAKRFIWGFLSSGFCLYDRPYSIG